MSNESRSALSALLKLAQVRPFAISMELDPLLRSAMESAGLKVLKAEEVSIERTRNKNPLVPICTWKTHPVGQDLEMSVPVCNKFSDQAKPNFFALPIL